MSEVLPKTGFQSPYDVPTPAGAEGWEEMYPYYLLFDPARREEEENRFWFYNGMHFPEPMPAFDMITGGSCYQSIGLYQGRVFSIPTVLGIEHRVVNGYIYITSNEVSDPAEIEKRLEDFLPRIGFYYANWDTLVDRWQVEVDKRIAELAALEVPRLPELEDEQEVIHDHKLGSNYRLMRSYDRTLQLYNELNQLHFELLLLGYGAYVTFFEFCKQAPSPRWATRGGADGRRLRHDHVPARRRAEGARRSAVDGRRRRRSPRAGLTTRCSPSSASRGPGPMAGRARGGKDPWFNMSAGDGFYHHHLAWADDLTVPFAAIAGYVEQIRPGRTSTGRPSGWLEERDRIADEYRALLDTDEERRRSTRCSASAGRSSPTSRGTSSTASTGSPRCFFQKIRAFGQLLADAGRSSRRRTTSSTSAHRGARGRSLDVSASPGRRAAPGSGPGYWQPTRRASASEIVEALAGGRRRPRSGRRARGAQRPGGEDALGHHRREASRPGSAVTATTQSTVRGYAASPGVGRGRRPGAAQRQRHRQIREGEVLVCPVTAPSWGPVFGKIAAAVSDIGGTMSHAAIVAREYGMPAVVGTGMATTRIKTGDRVRVDGDRGVVTVLS